MAAIGPQFEIDHGGHEAHLAQDVSPVPQAVRLQIDAQLPEARQGRAVWIVQTQIDQPQREPQGIDLRLVQAETMPQFLRHIALCPPI